MSNSNSKKYWAIFGLSVLATVALLVVKPEWCWVAFPFVFTYFVLALDWV